MEANDVIVASAAKGGDPRAALRPRAQLIRNCAVWAAWIAVAFFSVYPTLNWLTSLRTYRLRLLVPAELAVPFLPQFVWAHLSMYVLFLMPLLMVRSRDMPALGKQLVAGTVISGGIFLLLPADLGFTRMIPAQPFARLGRCL
jgi:hypothetical protein